MTTFLETVANDIFQRLDGHLEHLTIVFPNKRAGLFFNQHLAHYAKRPIWTPRYMTISELFREMSPLTVADPIHLICLLYPIYLKAIGKTAEEKPFDQFYAWGELMLSDFEDIDNNLARADKLFRNIEELNELTDLNFLSEQQLSTIKDFFTHFNPEQHTELKERFLDIWNHLLPIYETFREELRQRNLAYNGMLQRDIAETRPALPQNGCRQYAFVGFNVLTPSEQALFGHVRQSAEQTFFYWDFDTTYMEDNNPTGRFIRANIAKFGSTFSLDHPCYDNLSKPKNITFVSASTENAQARHAGDLLQSLKEKIQDAPLNQTAIVLCNEALLQPLLHSIPADYPLNVTMGFPLQQTPICTFLQAILDFQIHGQVRSGWWRIPSVLTLLNHPYTRHLAPSASADLVTELLHKKTPYASPELFKGDPFLSLIFQHQDTTPALLNYLSDITLYIGRSYADTPNTDFDTQLYLEAIFQVHTILNRLRTIFDTSTFTITRDTCVRLIRQLIRNRTIPFHGEPAVGLQVMGLLETRNLDFQNLIVLSTNEGNLPPRTRRASFIPYSLREAYGMTTIERQTNLYAYYFYRLLQRAENATLLYNNNTDGLTRGEMSRFMMQLLIHPTIGPTICQQHLTSPLSTAPRSITELSLTATSAPMKPIKLSPSAINTYLNCPLKYYLQYIVKLKPEAAQTEEIGNDIFGTIFHQCMEDIYTQNFPLNRPIQSHQLQQLANKRDELAHITDRAFNKVFFNLSEEELDNTPRYNGNQQLRREVVITLLQKQLKYDATLCPLTVLHVEYDKAVTTLRLPDTSFPHSEIQLGGIIDRVDRITKDGKEYLRIVDYKTSQKAQTAANIDALFDIAHPDKRPYHILQAFYYADVYTDVHPDTPVAPALMYVHSAHPDTHLPFIQLTGTEEKDITDFATQCKAEFHDKVVETVLDILNPEIPFTQSPTRHACKYCDFAHLCGRTDET